ncbi:VCBS domain-containing protein [Bradyrhizobium algeriense]|uniref:Npun_F0296 family exosortase-dependent surface protein n=1 Tax=Bradyrhizobium algeriense TaxID=634784 RepID=UPI000D3D7A53|nr:VCBS domain-containing protein [Bradyrhizobium algeriense]
MAGKFTDVLSDAHGSHPHGSVRVDSVSTHAPVDAIIVPDAHLLFTGDFKRSGVDLVLTSGDRELVLPDYFRGEKRAALASPDGAHLTGDIVNALAGHIQFAQADGSASAAPALIGHVTKLTGSATAIRNGVSIILNQGDTVHKGDVVQSGSDSTLGITFIDGTVFGLASNAKMVLNEMIYDPNGSDNKSLLSLVQGTISFVAGATAKKGDMKVDTPVATMGIRGTAVLVEIDFEVPSHGGAPPAKFQVLVEPDGTTGSYILFDKTTLTPIATVNRAGTQTIINGQGSVSFQSSVQLSPETQKLITDVFSQKFTDLNNPNTKLTTNFTDSIVPQTSFLKLASNDLVPVTFQFVNVPDKPAPLPGTGPGPTPDHIPGPPAAAAHGSSFTERTDITASAAVDSVSGTVSYADINPNDVPSVQAAFSSFTYANAQKADVTATLTAEQLAAIKAVEVPLSVVQDPNGKNTGQATWTYNIADGAFDFLASGETLTLTYMARVDNNYAPSNETTFVPFTIVITGTNDKPTLSATGGTITERIGTGNTAVDTVTGTVTFADADLTDRPVVSAAISTTDPFRYYDAEGNDVTATLTPAQLAAILAVEVPLSVVQAAGNTHNGSATWTYSIEDSKFDFIAKGETLTLNYVAQVDDGHGGVISTPITVSIHGADVVVTGTNDLPTIATTSAAFAEFSNLDQPNPTGSNALHVAAGTISFTDVDLTDRPVASTAFTAFSYLNAYSVDVTSQLTAKQLAAIAAVDEPLTVVQNSGNTNNGSASWSYSAADSAFDFLADGEILNLTYTATVNDGHGGVVTKPITVTVTGSNDTAEITSDEQAATISERADTHDSATPDTASGAITFNDADLTDTHDVEIASVNASGVLTGLANGTVQLSWLSLGPLADSTDGVRGSKSWSFSAPDSYFDYLADGEAVTLTYTVEVDDHHGGVTSQDIVVTINGSNDAPLIVGEVDPPVQTVILAAPTQPIVLASGVSVNSLGLNTETFDSLSAGSPFNNGAGYGNFQSTALGATFAASGNAGIVNGFPTATTTHAPSPGNQQPTNYLSIGGGGTETITFASEKNAFGLYWGSLDSYNTIKFYDGTTPVASYTGNDISPLFPTGNQSSFSSNGYVEFSGLPPFNKVVLSSSSNAFEIDNISAGNVPGPDTGLSGPIKGTLSVYDGDIGDTLTAFVKGNATIEYNGSASVPGSIDISALVDAADVTFDTAPSNGGTVVLNWSYQPINANLDFLHAGDILKIKFVAEVSDGHGHTGSQPLTITLIGANSTTSGSGSLAAGPVIGTDAFSITENGDGTTTVSGLYVSDSDATAPNDTFTIHAAANSASGSVIPPTGDGSLAVVNAALDNGIVYDPGNDPPQTDMVTLTVSDGLGHSDTVHFVFNEAAQRPLTLTGTSGKDVIFATGSNDTLTGGGAGDQFVFAPELTINSDTITDFDVTRDKIDVRQFGNINSWTDITAVQQGNDTVITLDNNTSVLLKNVVASSLHANDFIVHG